MKLRHYLSLFPFSRHYGFYLHGAIILACLTLGVFFDDRPKDRPGFDDTLFVLTVLFFPLCLGVLYSLVWKKPQHRLHAVLLPGFQPRLLGWQVACLTAVCVLWTLFLRVIAPGLPSAAAFPIVFGALTLPLPFERGFWLAQARWPFVSLLVLIGLAATHRAETRALLLAHPWPAATVGLLVATASIALARSREALRRRANRPDLLGMDPDRIQQEMLRDRQRRGVPASSRFMPKSWHYPPRGDSLVRWVRAKIETQPGNKWVFFVVTLISVLVMPLIVSVFHWSPVGWHNWIFRPDESAPGDGSFFIMILLLPSSAPQVIPGAGIFYPLARHRRTRVAFVGAILNTAALWLTLAGGALAAGFLGALWVGQPAPSHLALEFLVRTATVLPFIPILQWMALRSSSPQRQVASFLGYLLAAGASQLAMAFVLKQGLASGAMICAAGIVLSQIVFFFALRHLFAKRDLMYATTPARCMGLV